MKVGDIIEKREIMFPVGRRYTPYIVETVETGSFFAVPLKPSEEHLPTWFLFSMKGQSWR